MSKALSTINIKIDKELKEQAVKVLDDLGLNQSVVITMLYKQLVLKKELPFEVSLTRTTTKKK